MATLARHFRTLLACALGLAAGAGFAQAKDDYPSRPIRLVIPYAAGGLSDGVVRAVADELERTHKMKVVVENRTGGNTIPAALAVTKAAPDGYTVGWFSASTFTTVPVLTPNLPFKTSEFQPVFMAYRGPIVMAVANNVPATNAAEYIAYARKQSARALVGATAKGGAGHLMAAALGHDARVDVELIAYRGGPPMVLELLSGQLPAPSTSWTPSCSSTRRRSCASSATPARGGSRCCPRCRPSRRRAFPT
jgi:tripartite-type tricarboxylate transporter receptor subunit TctC